MQVKAELFQTKLFMKNHAKKRIFKKNELILE